MPIAAIVLPPFSMAVVCAAVSTPFANAEAMVSPSLTRRFTSLRDQPASSAHAVLGDAAGTYDRNPFREVDQIPPASVVQGFDGLRGITPSVGIAADPCTRPPTS